ncbi:calmodulin [Striga asiatica]|uniref:Calmodulin n=1 Tax=Striga asiatica TaxID=4170 RepID=A0A5A7P175_STRAF|nr:calmodulin [Striga asiatica]
MYKIPALPYSHVKKTNPQIPNEHYEKSKTLTTKMRKLKPSKSDGDELVSSEGGGSENLQTVSNYEMQRLKTIEENKKRMEAWGCAKWQIPSWDLFINLIQTIMIEREREKSTTRMTSIIQLKTMREQVPHPKIMKVKKNSVTPKKRGAVQKTTPSSDFVEDDDEALMQAIALSLQDTTNAAANDKRKEIPRSQNDSGKMKRKKPIGGRVKMTEDEMLVHFFQFDETGKGGFTLRDVQRLAMAHDFTWSEKELADMIYCFDTDGDGKINYDDFRKIVSGCNMLKGSDVGETSKLLLRK